MSAVAAAGGWEARNATIASTPTDAAAAPTTIEEPKSMPKAIPALAVRK